MYQNTFCAMLKTGSLAGRVTVPPNTTGERGLCSTGSHVVLSGGEAATMVLTPSLESMGTKDTGPLGSHE